MFPSTLITHCVTAKFVRLSCILHSADLLNADSAVIERAQANH